MGDLLQPFIGLAKPAEVDEIADLLIARFPFLDQNALVRRALERLLCHETRAAVVIAREDGLLRAVAVVRVRRFGPATIESLCRSHDWDSPLRSQILDLFYRAVVEHCDRLMKAAPMPLVFFNTRNAAVISRFEAACEHLGTLAVRGVFGSDRWYGRPRKEASKVWLAHLAFLLVRVVSMERILDDLGHPARIRLRNHLFETSGAAGDSRSRVGDRRGGDHR